MGWKRSVHGSSQNLGTPKRPQNTTVHILGTPNNSTPNFGKSPHRNAEFFLLSDGVAGAVVVVLDAPQVQHGVSGAFQHISQQKGQNKIA